MYNFPTSLKTLDLGENHLTHESIPSLVQILKNSQWLTYLNIFKANIGDAGIDRFLLGLYYKHQYVVIDLKASRITKASLPSIIEFSSNEYCRNIKINFCVNSISKLLAMKAEATISHNCINKNAQICLVSSKIREKYQ